MILLAVLIGLTAALYPLSHLGFRDGLQALLRNFDIALSSTSARSERTGVPVLN